MTALHVAILTPGFAEDEAETNCVPALQDFLLALRRQHPSIGVTVFTLRYPYKRRPYEWHGVPVYPANGRQHGFPRSLLSWGRLMHSFARVNRRNRVHLIHSVWLGECAFLGERLSRLYGVPHIVTLMGQEVALPNRYARLLEAKHTTFVAVSAFQGRELLKRTGREPDHVIPWGLDHLPSGSSEARDIDVLGVGSLTNVKDFDSFLDVVACLRELRPTLSCRIAGDGPLRFALEAKAKRLGLETVLKFEGRVSRERVFGLMRRSKVLLHTSIFESFGLVFAEAQACGARIVSRPVGIAEPNANWTLCTDPNDMCSAVNRVMGEGDLMPQADYPIENTVRGYHALYSAVCGLDHSSR